MAAAWLGSREVLVAFFATNARARAELPLMHMCGRRYACVERYVCNCM